MLLLLLLLGVVVVVLLGAVLLLPLGAVLLLLLGVLLLLVSVTWTLAFFLAASIQSRTPLYVVPSEVEDVPAVGKM